MLTVFIGYDPRDDKAFRVAEASLKQRSSIPVCVKPIRDWECRKEGYARTYMKTSTGQMIDGVDAKPFSTDFSFTRFMVPHLMGFADELCLFMDPDMLVRCDIAEIAALCTGDKAVWCVQHKHTPSETVKMDGIAQTQYLRKNWSSFVAWNPSRNQFLTPKRVSELPGSYLHAFTWLKDEEIGELPETYNWLEGWSDPMMNPKVVHFTRGTPDFAGYENAPYADEWRKMWKTRGPSELERTLWT
jgi:hypothetical protein